MVELLPSICYVVSKTTFTHVLGVIHWYEYVTQFSEKVNGVL
jgi:hypothetical protein